MATRKQYKQLTSEGIKKRKPGKDREEIRDGTRPLLLVVQPKSGVKSFAMRFRRPSGEGVKLTLGPFSPNAEDAKEPILGQPLTLASARVLVEKIEQQRAEGIDVVENYRLRKLSRRSVAARNAASTFAGEAQWFIDGYKIEKGPRKGQRPRGGRETARLLGLDYPKDGGDPTIIKGGLSDRWRNTPVTAITKDAILDLIEEAERHGVPGIESRNAGSSEARSRHLAAALGAMFRWLSKKRRISVSPFVGMDRPPPSTKREMVLNFRAEIRKADELRWFWKACEEIGGPFGAALQLLLITACRRDEIALMTWDELNDDRTTLRLPGDRTKSGRDHEVPLSATARDIIQGLPRLSDRYVFSTNGKTPISGFNRIKKSIDALMIAQAEKEKAEFRPFRIHDLRRTAATGMVTNGTLPHVAEAVLGHSPGGLIAVYQHADFAAEKRQALASWGSYVRRIVDGQTAKVVPIRKRK
jgi:integrase